MNSALWAAAVTGLAGAVVGREHQDQARQLAGDKWQDNDLVFASGVGTALDAANVHRSFRKVIAAAGLDPAEWTPRELRHSFVSLLSDAGVPIEKIARLPLPRFKRPSTLSETPLPTHNSG